MERECDNCKHKIKGIEQYPCVRCIRNATDMWEPETNADHIRAMSDEELAEFIEKAETAGYNDDSLADLENNGYIDTLEWLKSPIG